MRSKSWAHVVVAVVEAKGDGSPGRRNVRLKSFPMLRVVCATGILGITSLQAPDGGHERQQSQQKFHFRNSAGELDVNTTMQCDTADSTERPMGNISAVEMVNYESVVALKARRPSLEMAHSNGPLPTAIETIGMFNIPAATGQSH